MWAETTTTGLQKWSYLQFLGCLSELPNNFHGICGESIGGFGSGRCLQEKEDFKVLCICKIQGST